MMHATVNDKNSYSVEVTPDGVTIDEQSYPSDVHQYGGRHFHYIHRRAGYAIELLEADYQAKSFVFRIQGKTIRIHLKNELDLLVEALGMAQSVETTVSEITAPMPGLIVGLNVAEGQAISQGDSVLTLEAMKMENVIKSPIDGTVSAIHVKTGDSVDKNQVLISFQGVSG